MRHEGGNDGTSEVEAGRASLQEETLEEKIERIRGLSSQEKESLLVDLVNDYEGIHFFLEHISLFKDCPLLDICNTRIRDRFFSKMLLEERDKLPFSNTELLLLYEEAGQLHRIGEYLFWFSYEERRRILSKLIDQGFFKKIVSRFMYLDSKDALELFEEKKGQLSLEDFSALLPYAEILGFDVEEILDRACMDDAVLFQLPLRPVIHKKEIKGILARRNLLANLIEKDEWELFAGSLGKTDEDKTVFAMALIESGHLSKLVDYSDAFFPCSPEIASKMFEINPAAAVDCLPIFSAVPEYILQYALSQDDLSDDAAYHFMRSLLTKDQKKRVLKKLYEVRYSAFIIFLSSLDREDLESAAIFFQENMESDGIRFPDGGLKFDRKTIEKLFILFPKMNLYEYQEDILTKKVDRQTVESLEKRGRYRELSAALHIRKKLGLSDFSDIATRMTEVLEQKTQERGPYSFVEAKKMDIFEEIVRFYVDDRTLYEQEKTSFLELNFKEKIRRLDFEASAEQRQTKLLNYIGDYLIYLVLGELKSYGGYQRYPLHRSLQELQAASLETIQDFFQEAITIFSDFKNWNLSVGGGAWIRIAQLGVDFWSLDQRSGKRARVLIDKAFQLEHLNGGIFDKIPSRIVFDVRAKKLLTGAFEARDPRDFITVTRQLDPESRKNLPFLSSYE